MNKIIICLNCKIQKLLTSQNVIPRHVTVCILKKNSEGREKSTCSTRPSKYLVLHISRVRVFSLAFCLSPKFETTKKIGFHHFSKLASMFTRTVHSQSLGSMAGISPFLPSNPPFSHFLLSSRFSRGQNIENRFPRWCFPPKSNVNACHAVSRCSNGYGSENAP